MSTLGAWIGWGDRGAYYRPMDADLGSVPSPDEMDDLKAQWVEAIRPMIRLYPKPLRKQVLGGLLDSMKCNGWDPAEAASIVADLSDG